MKQYFKIIGSARALPGRCITAEELDRAPADFPAVSRVADLTSRMVEIDGIWDELKAAKDADWPKPGDSAGAAVLLIEQYREMARTPDAKRFGKRLADAETEAGMLERALRSSDATRANTAFAASKAICQRCHDEFRDRAK